MRLLRLLPTNLIGGAKVAESLNSGKRPDLNYESDTTMNTQRYTPMSFILRTLTLLRESFTDSAEEDRQNVYDLIDSMWFRDLPTRLVFGLTISEYMRLYTIGVHRYDLALEPKEADADYFCFRHLYTYFYVYAPGLNSDFIIVFALIWSLSEFIDHYPSPLIITVSIEIIDDEITCDPCGPMELSWCYQV